MLAPARHDPSRRQTLNAGAPTAHPSRPETDRLHTRVSRPADWIEMLELLDRCFPHATEAMMGHWLCHQRPMMHVARIGGKVAGFVHVQIRPESGTLWINMLAVTEDHRHRGVARHLLAHCERLAAQWGLGRLGLQCHEDNLAALRLYQRQGHRRVGETIRAHAGGRYIVHDKPLPCTTPARPCTPPQPDPRWQRLALRLLYLGWFRRQARLTR
ncbi:MAG: hypothetical protein RLZZ592_1955 [Pseudomonadota bacterium]|jgi:ribosomal protein S18 acetylase RimI-like enzyme